MTGSRYVCSLSAEVQKKAKDELNEPLDDMERVQAIDRLLEVYEEKYPSEKIEGEERDDRFLIRFLRARKFDVQRSVEMLHKYLHRRDVFPEAFEKIDHPQVLKDFLETHPFTILPGTAENGSTVILLRPAIGTSRPQVLNMFGCGFLIMEKLLEKEEVQVNGITLMEDFNYFNLYVMRQMGPILARKFLSMLQDTLPIRLKNILFVNESTFFSFVFSIIRPFLKEKTKRRMVMVGSQYDKIHQLVDLSYLPKEYGGPVEEDQLGHEQLIEMIFGSEESSSI